MEPEKRKKSSDCLKRHTICSSPSLGPSSTSSLEPVKALGGNFWTNFLLHGAYELKDQGNTDEVYNSMFNSVGDQVCSMAGFFYAKSGDTMWINAFLFGFLLAVAFRD